VVHGKDVSNLQGRSEEREKRRNDCLHCYIVERLMNVCTKNGAQTAVVVVPIITGSRMVTLITESI
jgi:hypothetical protein